MRVVEREGGVEIEGRGVGIVPNGRPVELYVDVRRTWKRVVPSLLVIFAAAAFLIVKGPRWEALTLVSAVGVALLAVMFPLLLVSARRRPVVLLTDNGIAQNVPGGLDIRWTEIGTVDSLGTSHGTFVRLHVRHHAMITDAVGLRR